MTPLAKLQVKIGGMACSFCVETINCAGMTLRAIEKDGTWTVNQVRTASCAVGHEVLVLPDHMQPGDTIECHGWRQRVTYEYGAWALVKLSGGDPASTHGLAAQSEGTIPVAERVRVGQDAMR